MRFRRHGDPRPPFLVTEDDKEEETSLIRTSGTEIRELADKQARIWDPAVTSTAADYTHYVNPSVIVSNTATGAAYTAASLGLTDST